MTPSQNLEYQTPQSPNIILFLVQFSITMQNLFRRRPPWLFLHQIIPNFNCQSESITGELSFFPNLLIIQLLISALLHLINSFLMLFHLFLQFFSQIFSLFFVFDIFILYNSLQLLLQVFYSQNQIFLFVSVIQIQLSDLISLLLFFFFRVCI